MSATYWLAIVFSAVLVGCGTAMVGDGSEAPPSETTDTPVLSDDGTTTTAQLVTAAGTPIGVLVGADEYTLTVWDTAHQLIFKVNDSTGFVARWYETDLRGEAGCS